MMRSKWAAVVAVVLAAGVPAASAAPQSAPREKAAGEGVLCAIALYSGIAEAARTCTPETAPEFQAELRRQVERLDAYALANGMTTEGLAGFKSQNLAGLGDPSMCAAYREEGLEEVLTADPEAMRTTVDELVARPGTPTWGSCI
ncbi:hypothetical protein [Brevundimonas sp.]|uniref:hypothetical protein n=1 Tax=Brevundimonas sp. TaxID=1871086 RepID=UPI002737ACFF|nr:hypothetical protein [Brevundimonas sp.]MDP3802345.1 hypothetical protein [Brevundimonas sp.]